MASFWKGVEYFIEEGDNGNETTSAECESAIDHYKFYQFTLIPAVLIIAMLAATRKRRQVLLGALDGRPGLLSPMDTMTRTTRVSYACAFGATALLISNIVLAQKYAIDYTGPGSLKTLIAIVSMVIYGLVFFPVFACLALGTAFSYGVGSLYMWVFTIIDFILLSECSMTSTQRVITIVGYLPVLLCDVYLSVSLPFRFVVACREHTYFTADEDKKDKVETVSDIRKSYQGQHVMALLRKAKSKPPPPEGFSQKAKEAVMNIIHKLIYKKQTGFRYPARILSVMFVAAVVVYIATVQLLASTVYYFNSVMQYAESIIEDVGGWEEIQGEPEEITSVRFISIQVYDWARILRTCCIVSISVSGVITLVSTLHMLSSFRENLYAMYRGDYRRIPSPYEKGATDLCNVIYIPQVGSIKYAGFQVAYVFWSFIIVTIILFIVSFALAAIITLSLKGFADWIVNRLKDIWPGILVAIILIVGQKLLAKFFFLQGKGQYLRLDNRRFFFVFTYFMFFYNIFLGLVSCLLRIIKAIGVGTILLARLDNSTLPRRFEFFDPGFSAYQGFIHMEAAHSHPVIIVFIELLRSLSMQNRLSKPASGKETTVNMEESTNATVVNGGSVKTEQQKFPEQRNLAARFNWHVTYTLLHNPQIRVYRKGFIQAMKKAREEGVRIPISDRPVTDFDLVKILQDREEKEMVQRKTDQGDSKTIGGKLKDRLFKRNKDKGKEKCNISSVCLDSVELDLKEESEDESIQKKTVL